MAVVSSTIGAAVIGTYATKKAASKSSSASAAGAADAAEATVQSTQMQIEEMRRQFDMQMNILQPQIQRQMEAQKAYQNLLGLPSGPEQSYAQTDEQRQLSLLQTRQSQFPSGSPEWQDVQSQIDAIPPQAPTDGTMYAGGTPGAGGDIIAPPRTVGGLPPAGPPGVAPGENVIQGRLQGPQLAEGAAGEGVYGDVFTESPGFAFQREEMERQLERVGSAGGPNIGGRAIMEAQRRAQGLAKGDYYNWAQGRTKDLTRKATAESMDASAYQNMLSQAAGFGGGASANAVGVAGAQARNVSGAIGAEGSTLANIYSQQGNIQGQIQANKYAGYNNFIQGGMQNYMTANQANI